MDLISKLAKIQSELKVPKSQYNSFGKYSYRSCEDILDGIKPLLSSTKCALTLSDKVESIGDRLYIKAVVTLLDCESADSISNTAYAREEDFKKGMDVCQITGTASSYARKYALNGLFCIDDTKDADTDEYTIRTKPLVCSECGKAFASYTDKDKKVWTEKQVYQMSIKSAKKNGINDGKARCSACLNKLIKAKEGSNE